jgi:hypothetical protein
MADLTCILDLSLGIKYCLEFSFYDTEAPKKKEKVIKMKGKIALNTHED